MSTAPRWQRLKDAAKAFGRVLAQGEPAPGNRDRLSHLLSAAPVVVYAIDLHPDFPVTYVSANVARLSGLGAKDVMGLHWEKIVHPDDRSRRRAALAELSSTGHMAMEYRFRHANGSGDWRWVRDEARLISRGPDQPDEVVGSWLDITERHASEEALAASEVQLRVTQRLLTDALESSGDAFSLFDGKDRLVMFNSRYRTTYPTITHMIRPGVTFEDLLRISAAQGQYQGVEPEHVEQWVLERLARHRAATGVFEQHLSDGRCLEIVERPTSGGGRVAMRRDVTARKRIEEALRQELAFEQTLIDALPFPVFFKGIDGRFLGCNTQFSQAVGKPQTAIIGRTLYDLLPQDKAEELARADAELFANPGVVSAETTMRWADGSIRRVNVVRGPFNASDGTLGGLIGSFMDLTQQKRTEEQLIQTAKLATLGQIASEVAHELNQPLSIIRMSAEGCLQARGDLASEQIRRKLETIAGQVRRMAEIVDHLRSFSRLETGEKKPFSPAPVVNAVAKLLTQQFQLDGTALMVDVAPDCPDICGQPNQLEQVVLNLLTNARDAVRSAVPMGKGQVTLGLTAKDDQVVLTVHDNGGGIADDLWPMVFEPFFTTKADGAGTGLGLSISTHIVTGMGGQISGCNANGGALFSVSLPAHKSTRLAAPAIAGPVAPPTTTPCPTGQRGRILVVDDEPLAVECIAEYLERRGFTVATATSPDQALAAAQDHLDMVISDMRMPGLDGTALLARLRQDRPDLPAILMTGGPLPSECPAARTTMVRKPLALSELGEHVDHLLRDEQTACNA